MQKRLVEEYCFYVIVLNPMRGAAEDLRPVAAFSELEEALAFYKGCLAPEPWTDDSKEVEDCYGQKHDYTKAFRKGSPLEWFNEPFQVDFQERYSDAMGAGIVEHWLRSPSVDQIDWNIPINPKL